MTSNASKMAKEVVRHTNLLIGGEFCASHSGKTFPTVNPATEEVITQIAEGGEEDIDRAAQTARKAFESSQWKNISGRERGRLLNTWADLIEQEHEEFAKLETLDSGKPISDSLNGDVPGAIEVIRYFAGWADKLHGQTIPLPGPYFSYTKREPIGVCGQIIPWNYPMNMAAWKMAPALAAGCSLVLKPAEQTPLTALRMGALALEAGFPPGIVNVVTGMGETAGAALVRHPEVNKIAFTGETTTAKIIQQNAADTMKRLTFELGGKSPNIVYKDADLDLAAKGSFGAIFSNMGQNCCAGSRLFLHEDIHDEFIAMLKSLAEKRKVGDPLDPKTEHGPQIDKAQYDKILHYINLGKKEGAKCISGGDSKGNKGFFVNPTIFCDVKDDMSIAADEIFGPVVSVFKYKDLDEVLKRANNTQFGLASAIWTQNLNVAQKVTDTLNAGTVWVNCYNIVDTAAPFGGFKMSGYGRELGEKAFDSYTENKTVTMFKG